MRFEALLFAALLAVASGVDFWSWEAVRQRKADEAFNRIITSEFPKQVAAINVERLPLEDVEFSVAASSEEFPERRVTMRQGKVEGLSTVVRPRGRCIPQENGDFACHLTFDGLRITYEANASNPVETFPVEVYAAHSLVEVVMVKECGRGYVLRDLKLRSLLLWDRLPREFVSDPSQNLAFQTELRVKLHDMLKDTTLTHAVKQALSKAFFSQFY